jgi:hypothetical protein
MAPLEYKSSLARYRRYLQSSRNRPLWKASFYTILSLGLVIFLVLVALRPTLITIASLIGEIRQQREVSQKLNEKISAISRAQQELAQVSGRLVLLDDSLPIEVRVGKWDETVQLIAQETGILLEDLSVSDITIVDPASNSSQMKFQLTAGGVFENLKQFVQIFEGTRRLILIDDVKIARSSINEGQLLLTISGTLGNFDQ